MRGWYEARSILLPWVRGWYEARSILLPLGETVGMRRIQPPTTLRMSTMRCIQPSYPIYAPLSTLGVYTILYIPGYTTPPPGPLLHCPTRRCRVGSLTALERGVTELFVRQEGLTVIPVTDTDVTVRHRCCRYERRGTSVRLEVGSMSNVDHAARRNVCLLVTAEQQCAHLSHPPCAAC